MFLRQTSEPRAPSGALLTEVPTNRLTSPLPRASILSSGTPAITPPLYLHTRDSCSINLSGEFTAADDSERSRTVVLSSTTRPGPGEECRREFSCHPACLPGCRGRIPSTKNPASLLAGSRERSLLWTPRNQLHTIDPASVKIGSAVYEPRGDPVGVPACSRRLRHDRTRGVSVREYYYHQENTHDTR